MTGQEAEVAGFGGWRCGFVRIGSHTDRSVGRNQLIELVRGPLCEDWLTQ